LDVLNQEKDKIMNSLNDVLEKEREKMEKIN